MLQLKKYQKDAIESTSSYLNSVVVQGAEKAFIEKKVTPGKPIPVYRTYGLGDIPYFCLRIPTGGGKTLLAAHLLRNVAHDYLMKPNMMVLWLVPTTVIMNQTLKALRDPRHPYREAIEDYFGGNVSVFSMAEISTITPDVLESELCIVVGTIQSLRTESTEGRNVYGHWEVFENHFVDLTSIPQKLDKDDYGKVKYSFANICYLHQPLIIMDEAHNARTPLSFDMLKRLAPSCIIELTATPNTSSNNGSNVLYSVTALELKSEDMIKLPIVLREHDSWQAAVSGTVMTRNVLQSEAVKEDKYIRPIALYQAQHKDQEITYEILLDYLLNQEFIPRDKIAIATGDVRDLADVDLFDPDCAIEHIITVEALKEGWDCSFAYVFCSVANRSSQKDVEQILGRVLRMPYAAKRISPQLNLAYAHVSSPIFAEAAKTLQDMLVDKLGFEKFEVSYAVVSTSSGVDSPDQTDLFDLQEEAKLVVSQIDTTQLSTRVMEAIKIESTESGIEIQIGNEIDSEMENELIAAVPDDQKEGLKEKIGLIRTSKVDFTEIVKPKFDPIRVPRLTYVDEQEVLVLESDDFLEFGQWDLNRFQAELPEFQIVEEDNVWKIDVDSHSKVKLEHDAVVGQLQALPPVDETSLSELILWIDKNIDHRDIEQAKSLKFIASTLNYLQDSKKIPLDKLLATKFLLARAITAKINGYRDAARKSGYQAIITETNTKLVVDFEYSFAFESDLACYPVSSVHEGGRYQYKKHFYEAIASMNGEEAECAASIDTNPNVMHWIRNLERQPERAFWLPTSTDKFYPDFIALLNDGRLLAIEYKGEMLKTTDDTKEKALVGFVWQKQSQGKCLFLMATKKDEKGRDLRTQIEDLIKGGEMSETFNIYCDESCHLLNDGQKAMVLGSLMAPYEKVKEIADFIKTLKMRYKMDVHNELKWVKISPNKVELYLELIDYFLENVDIKFRCIVVADKSQLQHTRYGRSHDDFYYVLYYLSLKFVLDKQVRYNIYFDYKDKNQTNQLVKLKSFLHNKVGLPGDSLKLQIVQSHESQLIQLADILTGAVSYKSRGITTSEAKLQIIEKIESKMQKNLDATSLVREEKFNIFRWTPKSISEIEC